MTTAEAPARPALLLRVVAVVGLLLCTVVVVRDLVEGGGALEIAYALLVAAGCLVVLRRDAVVRRSTAPRPVVPQQRALADQLPGRQPVQPPRSHVVVLPPTDS